LDYIKIKTAWLELKTIVSQNNILKVDNKRTEKKINISAFICHYFDRYIKILEYFLNKQDRGYIVDIVSGKIENYYLKMKILIKIFIKIKEIKIIYLMKL
tara:strand:- start:34 stop:333 length:300 start_codon:yes stop_codon:yes gene_type:complete